MAQLFLDEIARTHVTAGKQVVLVWDGAPAHRAGELRVPERITIVPLPAYTPELNPTERCGRWSKGAWRTAHMTHSPHWSVKSVSVVKASVPHKSRH
jgi:hypothetical protein